MRVTVHPALLVSMTAALFLLAVLNGALVSRLETLSRVSPPWECATVPTSPLKPKERYQLPGAPKNGEVDA